MKTSTLKKKNTIEQKILRPYIVLIVLLPVLIIVIFNLTMRFYIERNAREEIKNTLSATNMMLKQQFIRKPLDLSSEDDRMRFSEQIDFLNEIFKISKMAANTDIFIFSRTGDIVFPNKGNKDEALEAALKDMFPIEEIDGIQRFKVNQTTYLVAGAEIEVNDPQPGQRVFHAVYVASLDTANGNLMRVNIILLAIVGLTVLISAFIVKRIAASISKPIIEASDYADAISNGRYEPIEVHKTTYELHRLSNSLSEMSRKLEDQDRTQRNFLQNISHELRTPLMSIQGYAEGLVSGVFKEAEKPAQIIAV